MKLPALHLAFICAIVGVLYTGFLFATAPPPAATSPVKPAPAGALPLEQVSTQAESTSDQLHNLAADLASDAILSAMEEEWPVFVREVDSRIKESSKLVRADPSLDTLRREERSLTRMTSTLDNWSRQLNQRLQHLDMILNHLDQLSKTWEVTLSSSQESSIPPQAYKNIQTSITSVQKARAEVEARRMKLLAIQNRNEEVDRRLNSALDNVRQARKEVLDRLFLQDSPPIWKISAGSAAVAGWMVEGHSSLATQLRSLIAYAERERGRFLLHILLVLILVVVLCRVKNGVKALTAEDPEIAASIRIFHSPLSMAFVLSIACGRWIYPQPPRLWWAILGAVALFPATAMIRRLMAPRFFPLLNAGVLLYLADQLRLVMAAVPTISRILLTAELLGAVIFLVYRQRRTGIRRLSFWILVGPPAVALIACLFGYVSLAAFLGDAALASAYAAVLLYSLVKILEVLAMIMLHKPPLVWLRAVLQHRELIRHRIGWVLWGAACVLWALITLERAALRAPVINLVWKILFTPLTIKSLSLSLGNVLIFCFVVWTAFQVSRFVRFLLDEEIYPRLQLTQGLPYAISTLLHYAILVTGFLAATAALGLDMTKFTILAGAFGVGLGFGMQTIFNNFASGLILLFERPIKIGDVIQVENAEGRVETIGIRATTVRTDSGSRVIVPNGSLLASRVTNWSGSSRDRKIDLQVAVDPSANPTDIISLLEDVASGHPLIAKDPLPQALFVKQGAEALNFELHARTDKPAQAVQIRSELTLAINSALARSKIPIQTLPE